MSRHDARFRLIASPDERFKPRAVVWVRDPVRIASLNFLSSMPTFCIHQQRSNSYLLRHRLAATTHPNPDARINAEDGSGTGLGWTYISTAGSPTFILA